MNAEGSEYHFRDERAHVGEALAHLGLGDGVGERLFELRTTAGGVPAGAMRPNQYAASSG